MAPLFPRMPLPLHSTGVARAALFTAAATDLEHEKM